MLYGGVGGAGGERTVTLYVLALLQELMYHWMPCRKALHASGIAGALG